MVTRLVIFLFFAASFIWAPEVHAQSRLLPQTFFLTAPYVRITKPNDGETLKLGDSELVYINFDYGGGLDTKSGNYSYRIELWKNDKVLGKLTTLDRLPINPYESSVQYGSYLTHYTSENPVTKIDEGKKIEPGGEYSIKVILEEAFTPEGEATQYKKLAEDFTDKPITFEAAQSANTFAVYEKIFVKIASPNGGENIPLEGKELSSIKFDYGGSLDKKSGNYSYFIELWQSGKLLGRLTTLDKLPINPYESSVNYGLTWDKYIVKNAKTGIGEVREIKNGGGYQVRVVLQESFTPQGQPTEYKILAEDVSDEDFSLGGGKVGGIMGLFQTLVNWVNNLLGAIKF